MDEFVMWFTTGLAHICDWQGYDHILFVSSICILFDLVEWRKLIGVITAFTIGHSITLALSVFNVVKFPSAVIELLIPVTIFISSLTNIINRNKKLTNFKFYFLVIMFFGLIHGMGFSFMLKSLLGNQEEVVWPLLMFNLGLEFGQIIVIISVLLLSLFFRFLCNIKKEYMVISISMLTCVMAVYLIFERLTNLYN